MRLNLQCPFQDKDLAKQLGARWDPKLRVWYVENAPDLAPFARWLPPGAVGVGASGATATGAVAGPGKPGPARAADRPAKTGAVVTGPDTVMDCGCAALPWEPCDCVRTGDAPRTNPPA